MNKFEKDLNAKELFVQNFLDEFEKWAEANPPKTNVANQDCFTFEDLQKLYFSDK